MFSKARLKLTFWYLLILMLVSLSFSLVIYKGVSLELDRFTRLQKFRIERRFQEGEFLPAPRFRNIPPLMDPELVEETKQRLALILIAVNGGILILCGGLAFFLAGKTLRPIKEMVDEQNRFISDASHELKTPLTSLKTSLEVSLRDKNLTLKEAKKIISESIEEVNKLQSLSEGLLQLFQYQKPNNQMKFEKISLAQIIKKSIQRVLPLAKKKEITIEDQSQDFEFSGDQDALVDLLVILLDNAIKYSPKGKSVTIFSKKTDGSILISIKDQGIGIAEKDLPDVFDRFYRADLARSKEETGGYGLGLSIAKKIADAHHGKITVKSKLGEGSTFTVHLPSFFS